MHVEDPCLATALEFVDTSLGLATLDVIVGANETPPTINISAQDSESKLAGNQSGYDFCGDREYSISTGST